ncbi:MULTISPECIES: hypothetical protein [unclassified Planococcus (in: firmicutes)]|uniref:hypothetical protein n=1 Tax=unclassified Planococcus (in: firmicutes) TaxID=2662419 RepID=UPI000C31F12C|nr:MULTISPECIES: hypothetical protein [unclassified Planococcus (in: firmicutes)]AUD13068.1 hypothetical protein CW734_04465 [Planococcus sp. MB-3u-03]PKG45448.1 hypothetical protein CXF66_12585 [Planococcus sp. Urea-trap-24]PKG88955.1 hypothetical protein CXF91_08950 [Planococcus sp. Urea-3u-39]PKH36323.1 hypothetical protein CXF77_14620 [Planococcus sp. MB-3u-09]
MSNRLKNALLVIPTYGVVAFIMGYIIEGKPVWNLVLSSVIAGFLLVVFILPRMEKKRLEKEKKRQNSLEDN